MIKALFLGILGVVIIYTGYVSYHVGAFKPVTINVKENYQSKVLFIEHIGSYHLINKSLKELEKVLANKNISCLKSFGQYFDNPQVVAENRLRSHIGCLISGNFAPSPDFLDDLGKVQKLPVQTKEISLSKSVHAYFAGSPAIGPYKVYPKAFDFIEQKDLKKSDSVLEIYTRRGDSIVTDYYFEVLMTDTDYPE